MCYYQVVNFYQWACTCYYNPITVYIYRKCNYQCATCNGQGKTNCQSCSSGNYKWNGQDRCDTYCPTVAISGSGFGTNNRGQVISTVSARTCDLCAAGCSFCTGTGSGDCFSCTSGYYLIDDPAACISRFSHSLGGPDYTCESRKCIISCPAKYYYPVAQSTANSNVYIQSWTLAASQINSFGTPFSYRRNNYLGICYFCDPHCQQCNGPLQTNCQYCKRFNYMWYQRSEYCQETCPRGVYTWNSGDWYG